MTTLSGQFHGRVVELTSADRADTLSTRERVLSRAARAHPASGRLLTGGSSNRKLPLGHTAGIVAAHAISESPAYLALLGTVLLFGTSFPAIRRGLGGYSPGQMALLRLTVASVVLALVAARFGLRRSSRRQLAELAAVGFFGMAAYQLLLNSGERQVPAGPASLLLNLSPMFTAVLASVLLSDGSRDGPSWAWRSAAWAARWSRWGATRPRTSMPARC